MDVMAVGELILDVVEYCQSIDVVLVIDPNLGRVHIRDAGSQQDIRWFQADTWKEALDQLLMWLIATY
jgi:DNA topoisomerase VI subunit A